MIDKRLKYKAGQRVKKSSTRKRPGYRGDDYGAEARGTGGYSDATDTGDLGSEKANVANTKSAETNLGMDNIDRGRANQYKNMPTPTVTVGVDKFDNPINIKTTYTAKRARQKTLDALNKKGISSFDPRVTKLGISPFGFFAPKEKPKNFFDTFIGKTIKNIGLGIIAPQLLAGTKVGTVYNAYNTINRINKLANTLNLTDINVIESLKSNLTSPKSKKSTKTGPKDPPKEGGDGDNQQNALMAEYLLLLQKMEQGILQKEEQGRFNSLKSRLGKAKGGDVPPRSRLTADNILHNQAKKSEVKQFTPPERTGILQKLFGIDTDKLYDQGFDSMNKYRERNPDNPTEVLQLAGGKLSNLRHGVSTSLLRDDILKKINPGSYEMKEAPPSMNFEELKMSEEGPNKAAKGVASLLAYLGAGANEIGPGFFSKETMEDLTANLLGLMKTDVYDTPEDKAAMLNDILENDTGGINTYLQSLAPKEKYQEDAMLFPPMRQDKMRDQDLLFMKAEEEYDEKIKNLGLGDMDG